MIVLKTKKEDAGGLNFIRHVVHLEVEEERSLTSRKLKAAVLQKKGCPRLLDKKNNLPGSVKSP